MTLNRDDQGMYHTASFFFSPVEGIEERGILPVVRFDVSEVYS